MDIRRWFAYRSFWPEKEVVSQFAAEGVDIVCIYPSNTLNSLGVSYGSYPPIWKHRGVYDWDIMDKQFDEIIEANPKARFLCMIDLNTPGWLERFSEDNEDSFNKLGKVAASKSWRKDTAEYLNAFLNRTETKYGDRIEAYILSCGSTCEWQDRSKGEESESRCNAWRAWSKANGFGDPVDIPARSVREQASHGLLRDPQKDETAIRYWDFSRNLIADTILYFAEESQKIIKHRVKIGIFYGYIFEHASGRLVSEGHLGYDKVIASPSIDFFIAPASYSERQMGGTSGFMLTVDSLKLHGKGFIQELDQRTHTSNHNPLLKIGVEWGSGLNRWPDLKSSVAGLKREFAHSLIRGVSMWYFDMWNHWYDERELRDLIGSFKKIWDKELAKGEPKPAAEIAIIADTESCLLLNQNEQALDGLLSVLRSALGRIGAPYELYSFADLERIDFKRFKLIVFPNLFMIDDKRLELLNKTALGGARTVLWIYASGVVRNGIYDTANVEALTGLPYKAGAFAEKEMDSWKSVLHSNIGPNCEFLRKTAIKAGVHMYINSFASVYANERLIAIHSAEGVRRKIMLPKRALIVRELFSGRIAAENCTEFEDILAAPDTMLYEIEWSL